MAAQISLLRRGPRPSGAALAGGRSLAYSGGRFSALGTVPFSGGGLQQVVYAALVNAGATPEFARQVANSGNARALSVISRLSEGQIYQILGRNLSAPQLISALTQPTGGILHDIVGGLEEFFGTVLDIGGVLTAGATIPAGLTLNAEGARELALRSDRPRSQRASVSPPRPGFASYLAEGIEALPSAIRGGVNLANKIGSYFEPGPGPDGQPMAGRTSQGVPILDQTTDCPTCGGPPPEPAAGFQRVPE